MRAVRAHDPVETLGDGQQVGGRRAAGAAVAVAADAEVLREGVGEGEVRPPPLPAEQRLQGMVVAIQAVVEDLEIAVVLELAVGVGVARGVVEHRPHRDAVDVGDAPVREVLLLVADVAGLEVQRPGQPLLVGEAPGIGEGLLGIVGRQGAAPEDDAPAVRELRQVGQVAGVTQGNALHAVGDVDDAVVGLLGVVVAVGPEAASDNRAAGALDVVSEAHARLEEDPLHVGAGQRDTRVNRVPDDPGVGAGGSAGLVLAWVEDGQPPPLAVVPAPEVGDPQPGFQGHPGLDLPGVLEVTLDLAVADVVEDVLGLLVVLGVPAEEQVGEGVARAVATPGRADDLPVAVAVAVVEGVPLDLGGVLIAVREVDVGGGQDGLAGQRRVEHVGQGGRERVGLVVGHRRGRIRDLLVAVAPPEADREGL